MFHLTFSGGLGTGTASVTCHSFWRAVAFKALGFCTRGLKAWWRGMGYFVGVHRRFCRQLLSFLLMCPCSTCVGPDNSCWESLPLFASCLSSLVCLYCMSCVGNTKIPPVLWRSLLDSEETWEPIYYTLCTDVNCRASRANLCQGHPVSQGKVRSAAQQHISRMWIFVLRWRHLNCSPFLLSLPPTSQSLLFQLYRTRSIVSFLAV